MKAIHDLAIAAVFASGNMTSSTVTPSPWVSPAVVFSATSGFIATYILGTAATTTQAIFSSTNTVHSAGTSIAFADATTTGTRKRVKATWASSGGASNWMSVGFCEQTKAPHPKVRRSENETRTELYYLASTRRRCRPQHASITKPPANEAHVEGSGAAVTSVKATGVTPSASKKFSWNWALKSPYASLAALPDPSISNVNG